MSEISADILLDSITDTGSRLTTWELTYPRIIHAELLTHRELSRSSASSRAIPAAKLRQRVIDYPAIPVHWGANQKGMQADTEINDTGAAREWWLRGRDLMIKHHEEGERLGLHKQIINRDIEPWMMITVIMSSTGHANFFSLRKHSSAEPNIQRLACLMWEQFTTHMPTYVPPGGWHLPFIRSEDRIEVTSTHSSLSESTRFLKKVSVGRCARVSYLTHNGRRDLSEDVRLHDRLAATASEGDEPMHASPFEHVAQAMGTSARFANFEGWRQYRAEFPKESGPDTTIRCIRCGMWGNSHVLGCQPL